jgi:hypothetical protein
VVEVRNFLFNELKKRGDNMKRQAKIISEENVAAFEKTVNEFLESISEQELLDIKYSVAIPENTNEPVHAVMIIYKSE